MSVQVRKTGQNERPRALVSVRGLPPEPLIIDRGDSLEQARSLFRIPDVLQSLSLFRCQANPATPFGRSHGSSVPRSLVRWCSPGLSPVSTTRSRFPQFGAGRRLASSRAHST